MDTDTLLNDNLLADICICTLRVCVSVCSTGWIWDGMQYSILRKLFRPSTKISPEEERFCRNAGKVVEYVLDDCAGCCEEEDLPKGFMEEH